MAKYNQLLRIEEELGSTAIYAGLQSQPGSAVALSVVLLAVSLAVLIGLRGRWLGR